MLSRKIGEVVEIKKQNGQLDDIRVEINGEIFRAYNYPKMTGEVKVGDKVLLNTTAVELSLGTGGYHYVISNLDNMEADLEGQGHIMKLRYTPMQVRVDSVEDHESKYHDVFEEFETLNGMPVVVGTLHSMLTPFAATYKRLNPNKKLVYIMTDGAALPIYFSMNAATLKDKGLIDSTITFGNAFGGDYECINIYTALITAKEIVKADAVFISMGPGIAGTGTKYGFTGIEQGPILDAISKLGGRPIAIPRISFADMRDRHNGISHHSITIFGEIVNVEVEIPITIYSEEKDSVIKNQIKENNLDKKHKIEYIENNRTKDDIDSYGLKVKSMGRNYEQDSEFFDSASSAAIYITENK
ncbi:DUF3866 family protein [Peptacetobacter hiranonis]|uniref:DUF3866 family protein n=1 Tax=Peptacetobacter hiranonis (strain DSM 13275 / JCM 10541 / KCTC 15199 / TO-931) TaxID=500633 RepID=B6FZ53_PEPHT|nr:DUF3866 family protein [Peptacetobacter hiranonis]EEA85223.1 hypothetical protein CLOHIR_01157 [Peptacetobacter hiranonis DSM 13275]QEK20455.1 hypothetical protein KGNDJEFE_00938 [Peptacetobacter hiranonis]